MRDIELRNFLDDPVSHGGFHVIDKERQVGFPNFSVFLCKQFRSEVLTLNSDAHHGILKRDFNKHSFEIRGSSSHLPNNFGMMDKATLDPGDCGISSCKEHPIHIINN